MPNGRVVLYNNHDSIMAYDLAAKRSTLVTRDFDGALTISRAGDRIAYARESEDKKTDVAWEAARALGCAGDRAALPVLTKLASNPVTALEACALWAVGAINSTDIQTAKKLISMLAKEKDPGKRESIVYAMDSHRGILGLRLLVAKLKEVRQNDPDPKVRDAARVTIGNILLVLEEHILAGKEWKGVVKESYTHMWEVDAWRAEETFERWTKKVGINSSDIKDRPRWPLPKPPFPIRKSGRATSPANKTAGRQ